MILYEGFSDTGNDSDHEIARITSTEEEPKIIKSINVSALDSANGVILTAYIERDKVISEVNLKGISLDNPVGYLIEADLPVGQAFILMVRNTTIGANASIEGSISYTIKV